MLNDQIDFEFIFADGQENILDPNLVTSISQNLGTIISRLYLLSQSETIDPIANGVDIYLSSVRTGSLILSFVARARGGLVRSALDNPIGFVADSSALLALLIPVIGIVANQLNFAEPVNEVQARQPQTALEISITEKAIKDPEIRSSLEGLIIIAERSRASRVTIHIPEVPICNLIDHGSSNASLIGSRSSRLNIPYGTVTGKLKLTAETPAVTIYNDSTNVAIGDFTLEDGSEIPVLVQWNSIRPVPRAQSIGNRGPEVIIKGGLYDFREIRQMDHGRIRSDGPITSNLRRAVALLIVQTQIVEE